MGRVFSFKVVSECALVLLLLFKQISFAFGFELALSFARLLTNFPH